MNRHTFRAMGCEIVVAAEGAIPQAAVEGLFGDRERTFSRFVPGSELNRVNARAGRVVTLSPAFADALGVALHVAEETDGVVDPTVGAALEAAGYTRDFDELRPLADPPGTPSPGRWRSVLLVGRRMFAPPGVRIDLNGVVKATAVDDALALLDGPGFVSAGGDLAARGELTVALPDGGAVELRSGALATSGRSKRAWLRGGEVQHHLIDPRTGRPDDGPWEQVTACGADCLAADVSAKAGFLLGELGPAWLDHRAIPARFIDRAGSVRVNETWRRSMEGVMSCT